MEYKSIKELPNQYIPADNYELVGNAIRINSLYPQNRRTLKVEELMGLEFVEDTDFGFIIDFRKNEGDTFSKFYTSERLYGDLKRGIDEANPFFSRSEMPVVLVYIDSIIGAATQSENEESSLNIGLETNMGYSVNSDKFNYETVVRYIDWLVKPASLDNDNGLILPPKEYSSYKKFSE